ncbi:hypothetical protein QA635_01675 [Bradyrhizobium brasilense]|uniref:hypothetical protein n=1 Tax=Bradyrhizobium brasilense TaxID=1419277 RepID=UPI0024B03E2A|nr:hypothetical protein [Bradyrhizobium australafricanum]WFU33196.1 hypothetical protein QA635_01675 [Bradyrhizobium australafricanum]
MGLLVVGALAGILVGFGWFAPSRGYFLGCGSRPCFDKVAAARPTEPMPAALAPAPAIVKSNSATPAKSGRRPSSKKHGPPDLAKAASPRTRINVPTPEHAADTADPVLTKAKVTIAAQIEDPGSAEFSDMKRAMRKNTFGRAVDTICGRVKGRSASGGETGGRPFLYLVKEDEAYVVDGKSGSAASTAYRNICK